MSHVTFPKPSRIRERIADKREHEQDARTARQAVWQRDAYRCRVCHKPVTHAPDMLTAGHIHHIVLRSRDKGLRNNTANLLLLCPLCHSDAHAHRLHFRGNANTASFRFERSA